MSMKESQFYGGSAQEARDGRDSFRLREQAIEYGYKVRREKDTVVIVPNAPPDPDAVRCIDCRFYPDDCGYWKLEGHKDGKGNEISLVKPNSWHGCPDHEARTEPN